MNDFMYGLAAVKLDDLLLGYIEEGSFKLNGAKGEVTEINAAQKHGGPVLVIPKSNGTIAPSFDLIQMDYDNMATLMGGQVVKTGENTTGWAAPSALVQTSGKLTIQTDSSHEIVVKKAFVSAYIDGDLSLDSVSKIKVETKALIPDDGGSPFSINNKTA